MKGTAERVATIVRALVVDFGNRDLALLGIATGGYSFAYWCFAIALGVYAFDVGGTAAVGAIGLVRLAPAAIASPFAGVLVDRHSRRAVLAVSCLVTTLLLLGAGAAAAIEAPVALVFALAAAFTVAISPYLPAEGALLPLLARTPQELSAANVTFSTMDNVGFLLAGAGAGLALAVASPSTAFFLAAGGALLTTTLIAAIRPDRRPQYAEAPGSAGILRQTTLGFRALMRHEGLLLIGATLTLLVFFEGMVDVLVVVVALDLLGLGQGSVGFLNAAWGIGALLGAAGLTLLLGRGKLVVALAAGSITLAIAVAIPAAWPLPVAAYVAWVGIGVGYTLIEVAAKTLLQRLGDDETLGRAMGSLEAARQAAMAIGAIGAAGLVAVLGIRGALLALAAMMPAFVLLFWLRLRAYEIGAPVAEGAFRLLRENPIFAPLSMATLERLSQDLVGVDAGAGEEVITQGDHGDGFYLIEQGEVEVVEDGVFRRREGPGESFGEVALLHDVPRTATVRATEPTRLLRLGREQFVSAVTGHRRSGEAAHAVAAERWPGPPGR